ncbi:hypothetical protein [Flavobacterium sp.]|uniref:hypothetical protein n=1 Tax=Flavobacterium sp. TaxID=239 RepID=UPI002630EE17|nr:hypothetical protein [Flavobacterium sp.]
MEFRKVSLILLIAVVAFWITQGLDLWDSGYIVGYSWRIVNGELPYRDFYYKGPPATIFLWAWIMKTLPVFGQFFYLKLINWLLFLLQTHLWFKGIQLGLDWKIPYPKLMYFLGLVFSVQFFPMYPWPTTDGLLYTAIAFYLWALSNKKNRVNFYIPLIGLFTIAAALTKQSYYCIPIVFIISTALRYKPLNVIYLLFIQFVTLTLFIWGISQFTTLKEFLSHTMGETTVTDLIYSGFLNYFYDYKQRETLWILLGTASIFMLIYNLKIKAPWKISFQNIAILWGIFGLIWSIVISIQEGSRVLTIALAFSCLGWFNRDSKDRNKAAVLFCIGMVAWACAISLGYPYPIFMGTSLLILLIWLVTNRFPKYTSYFQGMMFIGVLIGTIYQFKPYAEKPINTLRYNIGAFSPKFAGIKTSKVHFDKLNELKILHFKYPNKRQIVAPNCAFYYYAMDIKNPLPADWLLNWEIHRDPKTILQIASRKESVIFVEKSFIQGNDEFMTSNRADFSIVTDYIVRYFQKINETKYFLVYKGSTLNAPLPQTSKT